MRGYVAPLLLVGGIAVALTAARADEVKTECKFGGAFNVKAFTGDNKGKTLCYV